MKSLVPLAGAVATVFTASIAVAFLDLPMPPGTESAFSYVLAPAAALAGYAAGSVLAKTWGLQRRLVGLTAILIFIFSVSLSSYFVLLSKDFVLPSYVLRIANVLAAILLASSICAFYTVAALSGLRLLAEVERDRDRVKRTPLRQYPGERTKYLSDHFASDLGRSTLVAASVAVFTAVGYALVCYFVSGMLLNYYLLATPLALALIFSVDWIIVEYRVNRGYFGFNKLEALELICYIYRTYRGNDRNQPPSRALRQPKMRHGYATIEAGITAEQV